MSSKRRLRANACTGKVKYVDEVAARSALIRVRRQSKEAHVTALNAYRCAFHGRTQPRHWHLGHSG